MIFTRTEIPGAYLIDVEPREDERGMFARTWCAGEYEAHGLNPRIVQCSVSYTKARGTLRGMHYQVPPRAEAKLVRCTRGAIFDVIIDLRAGSPAFSKHLAVILTAENRRMLYVPEGCAHGFQTLEDHTEVFYQMSEVYAPACARGVRWDDPAFGIRWPAGDPILSERDRTFPDFPDPSSASRRVG
ncbi:dTDP-4-dehydrorhamnose 3,5-epimerase [Candidatus Nitrospira bockiana]